MMREGEPLASLPAAPRRLSRLFAIASIAVVFLLASVRCAEAEAPPSAEGLGGFAPLTAWREPVVALPPTGSLDYARLAEEGMARASQWRRRNWYCEALRCPGRWPMLTIWGEVPMFEAADALQRVDPSKAHAAILRRFAEGSGRYRDSYIAGYVPYYEDHYRGVEAYFDDNGWLGLAFLGAYEDTGSRTHFHHSYGRLAFLPAQG